MRAAWVISLLLALLLGCQRPSGDSTYTGVLEGRTVRVPALVGGRLTQVRAEEGQQVKAGDTLALVDAAELELQARQVEAAQEEVAAQEEIAATSLARVSADLDYLEEKQERIRSLYENQTLSRQNLDDLSNQVQQARAAHQGAAQQLRVLQAKEKQLQVQLETIHKKLADAVVVAPAAGVVATRYFEPGEAIFPMQAVVELLQARELEVKIYIPQERLTQVKYGQQVRLRVDGVADELAGRVVWVSDRAEFTPKTILTPQTRAALVFAVKIAVSNPEGALKHGMPAEVELSTRP